MNKTIKMLTAAGFCLISLQGIHAQSYGQSDEDKVDLKALEKKDLSRPSFLKKGFELVDKLKQKVKENPKDEKAWNEYAQNLKGLLYHLSSSFLDKQWIADSVSTLNLEEEYREMLTQMERYIPNTATYAFARQDIYDKWGESMSTEEIMDKWPDAILHYPAYVREARANKDKKRLEDICKRWYNSGQYPADRLTFSHNMLASTEENALIIVNSIDIEPILVLQYGKGEFKDRKVVWSQSLDKYHLGEGIKGSMTKELGIPPFKPKQEKKKIDYSSASSFIKGFFGEQKEAVEHIVRYINRPVYFSKSGENMFVTNLLQDSLYSEGLLLKYSPKPYDNLAVLRRNYEHVYMLDYLKDAFQPNMPDSNTVNNDYLIYVPSLRPLLKFYKDSDDQTRYDELYALLRSVIDRTRLSGEIREKYLNSIENL